MSMIAHYRVSAQYLRSTDLCVILCARNASHLNLWMLRFYYNCSLDLGYFVSEALGDLVHHDSARLLASFQVVQPLRDSSLELAEPSFNILYKRFHLLHTPSDIGG